MQNFEARYQQLKAKITSLYEPSANRVVNAVEQSPLVVVTGPFSNGKSESLIPLIADKLVPKGYKTAIRDAQRVRYQRPNYAEGLMTSIDDHTNLLIIDEAGEIGQAGEGVQDVRDVLEVARKANRRIVSVIAYYAGNTVHRDKQTKVWTDAASEVLLENGVPIHLKPLRLRRDLAKELLDTRLSHISREVPIDRINYILENVPTNPGILDLMVQVLSLTLDESHRKFLLVLDDQIDGMRGIITEREAMRLKNTLDTDLSFKSK